MDRQEHILVVDDEPSIRFFLSEELIQAGYRVSTAASGEEALARLQQEPVDLLLLDLKMGGMDGLQVMAQVERLPLPPEVIILTAYASLESAIEAMRRGGHDYLRKPCRREELLASVERGLARRRKALRQQQLLRLIADSARRLQADAPLPEPDPPSVPRFLEARGLLLDREQQTVSRQGRSLPLTPTEFRLLRALMEQADRIVSYGQLLRETHGVDGEEREARQTLSTHLWRLRKKLGTAPDGRPYIVNVRGRGYRFISGQDQTR
ncbi:MAG TPA: response regulator transcription factor [Anaerolineae bacterium]|nr:response regulator transcription factor [Anaerolineae bacterium]